MLAPLRHRPFLVLWFSLVVSGVAQILLTVGVLVAVFEATGSALITAGVMVANTLPHFLFGPFAGAIVDRFPRHYVMLLAELVRAGLIGLLLWQVPPGATAGAVNIWFVYAIVFGLATAAAFHQPARLAIIPQLVPRYELVSANSIVLATIMGTQAIGFGLGGVLVIGLGFGTLAAISIALFVFAAALLLFVRPATAVDSGLQRRSPHLLRSIREGFSYLRHHEPARTLVIVEVLEHVPHGVWTSGMMLVFVQQALNGSPADWGLQNALWNIGVLLGTAVAAVLSSWLGRYPGWVIIANAGLFGMLTISYALSPSLGFALVLSFLSGPTFAMRDVAQDSLLQATVSQDIIGRVYALRGTFANLNFMIAGLIFAYLADVVSVRWLYLSAGVMYLTTAVYSLSKPAMRHSRIDAHATAVVADQPAAGD